jgi:hypothetical protein
MVKIFVLVLVKNLRKRESYKRKDNLAKFNRLVMQPRLRRIRIVDQTFRFYKSSVLNRTENCNNCCIPRIIYGLRDQWRYTHANATAVSVVVRDPNKDRYS